MKALTRLGNAIAILAVAFFLYLTLSQPSLVAQLALGLEQGYALLAAVVVYVAAMSVGALNWAVLLRAVGESLPAASAVSIVLLSQAAKYIPGNVAHHGGRIVLGRRQGLSLTNMLFTLFLETLWVIAIGSLVALVAIIVAGERIFSGVRQLPQWWILGGIVVAALIAPVLSHRLFEHLARWWAARRGEEARRVRLPSARAFSVVSLLYVINYLILGLVVQLIATRVFHAQGGGVLLLTGIFAVAWIIGFITPGAPAGLGVRELVLVAALTPVYDRETAIGIAAMLRVVTVIGDGAAFLFGLGLARWVRHRQAASSEA